MPWELPSGTAATRALRAQMGTALSVSNRSILAGGTPASPYKVTGPYLDLGLTTEAAPTVATWPTIPADAVAVELFPAAITVGPSDGFAFAIRSGILGNTGVLATNTANHTGATGTVPSRHVLGAQSMRLFLPARGVTPPATWRFALLNTNGIRMQGHFLSDANLLPYSMTATEEFLLVGANAQLTFPALTAAKFPSGYTAVVFQVIGTGVRYTTDGTATGAGTGRVLPAGIYDWDEVLHGVSFAAVKIYLPNGTFVVGHAIGPAL